MLMDAWMVSPVGNVIGNITSPGTDTLSLQCMSVSSKSNTSVFKWVDLGRFTVFSSKNYSYKFLAYSNP